jgi:hypothetical protein
MMYTLHPDTSIKLVEQFQAERRAQAALARSLVRERGASRFAGLRRSTGQTLIRAGESLLDPVSCGSPARA